MLVHRAVAVKASPPHWHSLDVRFNGRFPGGPGLAGTGMSPFRIFVGTKGDGGGGDNWSYKTCKAPVRMSPTNQHAVF